MYSPSLFSDDRFGLWNPSRSNDTKRAQVSGDESKFGRHLFAPPMQAYSTDYPGAYVSELDYTIQTMASSRSKLGIITPLVQRKLDQLLRIRSSGYSTLKPIGINKTMEEIDLEHSQSNSSHEVDDGSRHTAENTNNSQLLPEQDLDAQIENVDSLTNDIINDLSSDDGFMADDVEYQNDHSLNEQLLDSAVTAASPTFSGNIRSATTNPTTITSGAPARSTVNNENGIDSHGIEISNEIGNENDDMDMTMD